MGTMSVEDEESGESARARRGCTQSRDGRDWDERDNRALGCGTLS